MRDRPLHVLVMFGNGGGRLLDLNDYVGGFSFNCASSLKVQAFSLFCLTIQLLISIHSLRRSESMPTIEVSSDIACVYGSKRVFLETFRF